MSAESDFRALLAGHAGLAALVGQRIAQNAVPERPQFPLVVFTARHNRELGLDNTLLADDVSFDVQCWATRAVDAKAVAEQVVAACATAPTARCCVVVDESSAFDPDMQLDGVALTVEWLV